MSNTTKREALEIGLATGLFIIAILFMIFFSPKAGDVKVINCTWSEISPDFTLRMKEACRQARIENVQKDLQKPK